MEVEKVESDYRFHLKDAILGMQMLFVAFGALVLVPLIVGLNSSVALFTAGIGTLIFQVCTKGKVPIFLASSFAFIAPMIYGIQNWGIPATMCGLMAAGFLYIILSLLIMYFGVGFVHKIFPPIVTGPVLMTIGLLLVSVGVNMAIGKTGDGAAVLVPYPTAISVSMITLIVAIFVAVSRNKFLSLIPIFSAIIAGYIVSVFFGLIDFSKVVSVP